MLRFFKLLFAASFCRFFLPLLFAASFCRFFLPLLSCRLSLSLLVLASRSRFSFSLLAVPQALKKSSRGQFNASHRRAKNYLGFQIANRADTTSLHILWKCNNNFIVATARHSSLLYYAAPTVLNVGGMRRSLLASSIANNNCGVNCEEDQRGT
jgi:hypothetical protein